MVQNEHTDRRREVDDVRFATDNSILEFSDGGVGEVPA